MNINNLHDIDDTMLSKELIHKLEPYVHTQLIKDNIKQVTIEKGKSKTFVGNFYGLLKNELFIDSKYWYLNMRINGFKSSLDYNGETVINIVNSEILDLIIKK